MTTALKVAEIKKHGPSKDEFQRGLIDTQDRLREAISKIDFIREMLGIPSDKGLYISCSGLNGFFYIVSNISDELAKAEDLLETLRHDG